MKELKSFPVNPLMYLPNSHFIIFCYSGIYIIKDLKCHKEALIFCANSGGFKAIYFKAVCALAAYSSCL